MESAAAADRASERDVRTQLAVLLRSESFAHAPSLSRLLSHIVERTLAGRTGELKEYSLGVDVFDRGEAFDPKVDTIVRAQARRLRAKLAEYYEGEGRADPVVIELAKGGYAPTFTRRRPRASEPMLRPRPAEVVPLRPPSAAPTRSGLPLTIVLVAIVAIAVTAGTIVVPRLITAGRRSITDPSEYVQLTDFADSATAPALSPDGRFVTFIRGGEAFLSFGQIFVKALPDGDAVRLTSSENRKFAPVFTPDGTHVSYSELSRAPTLASWDTFTVSILGGEPSRLLANATGLVWLDPRHVMFSAFKRANHLGIVTSTDARVDERDIYFPAHERGMAHFSYLSPDRTAVLIVEMDGNGAFQSCRVVPFDGTAPGRPVGPPGSCRSAAWSPDGKWMYFGAVVAGASHLWRQAYPAGMPEQVTFGPTEEEGIAVAPDGRSLVTSIGRRRTEIWIHDPSGDRPVSTESSVYSPRLSSDGRRVYYLVRETPDALSSELRAVEIASGKVDRLVSGLPFPGRGDVHLDDFDVSRDGRDVVYAIRGADGSSTIWLAPLDRHAPPRELVRNGAFVTFGAHDDLFFVTQANNTSYFTRMKTDGTGRERVSAMSPIYDRGGVSPDGEWAVLFSAVASDTGPAGTLAVPMHGGQARRVCSGLCWAWWSADGHYFYVSVYDESSPDRTLVIPIPPGKMLPELPESGLNVPGNESAVPGLTAIKAFALPMPDSSRFLYMKTNVLRNLYRVPLH